MLPILYSFRRCPYAIRARLALRAAHIAVELREVALRAKPGALLAASPKATVPVLVLADGRVIDESLDIMLWALAQHDPARWLAGQDASLALIAANDTQFKPLLDRYKYSAPDSAERSAAQFAAQRACLAPLETRLDATRFLLGDTLTLADAAIVPFVRQFAAVDATGFATANPALHAWLATIAQSALFVSVMGKPAPWSADAAAARL
jgi:glutathione S-transferase